MSPDHAIQYHCTLEFIWALALQGNNSNLEYWEMSLTPGKVDEPTFGLALNSTFSFVHVGIPALPYRIDLPNYSVLQ